MLRPEVAPKVTPAEMGEGGEALQRALAYLSSTQHADGSWHGDYGGPMFLLPLYVATCHIAGIEIESEMRSEMLRYLRAHQNQDGGFGLHIEAESSMFPSSLNYAAARLLGETPAAAWLNQARAWITQQGGPTRSAAWGKYFLALLNLYDYEGLNPVTPELWLLPSSLPIHPSRWWCHCRMVYLPLAYLYGHRSRASEGELIRALREELYEEGYHTVDWSRARQDVATTDRVLPESPLLVLTQQLLVRFEQHCPPVLRKRALDFVLDQIESEDRNTNYICIGPISKLLHTLVWHFERPGGLEFRRHVERLPEYLYQAEDGLKMNGYNNSRLWDTAFAVQAMVATGVRAPGTLERAFGYLEAHQVLEDVADRERCFRHPSKGGWPFSTRDHGWPISDCTAEGLKACLAVEKATGRSLDRWRLDAAVDLILSLQNPDGGWATYEPTRGPAWLEWFNASDCFRDIMIDYSYVECTSACIQALAAYRERFGEADAARLVQPIERGRSFIESSQRADGSWEGSWGVCFTYGTWFGVLGLKAAGVESEAPAIRRAVEFLRSRQRADGSWGESVASCARRYYVPSASGQAVTTAWAMLALIAAGEGSSSAVERAARFLRDRQRPDGSFPPEGIAGVFNKTCGIHYDNYLKIFPLWALAAVGRSIEPARKLSLNTPDSDTS